MTAAQENIRQRVLAAMPTPAVEQAPPEPVFQAACVTPKKEPNNSLLAIIAAALGCGIVVMTLATAFVMAKKGSVPPEEMSRIEDRRQPQFDSVRPPQMGNFTTKAEFDAAMSSFNQRLAQLTTRMDHHQKRIWLLAVANNENVYVQQQVEAKHHGQSDPRYIVFDENWKLNRMPDNMMMDQDQQDRLKDNIKQWSK